MQVQMHVRTQLRTEARIPLATYRLQFSPGFGFKDALRIVPYLHDLGISDIYASPIFKSRKGSTHGYDVVDHNRLNPELGSEEDFKELVSALQERGMGLLLDIVPNHMAYSFENPMICDILERGGLSGYYRFFDIDWDHRFGGRSGKILAPILGDLYADALEKGEIGLTFSDGGFFADYHGFRLPLSLKSYPLILGLEKALEIKALETGGSEIVLTGELPPQIPGSLLDLMRHSEVSPEVCGGLKSVLWTLYNNDKTFRDFMDARLAIFKGNPGNPDSFSPMDRLLSVQIFWPSFWKVASREINYRRFFTINDLISLRVERQDVFDCIHTLLFDLVRSGAVTGIRIDHIDGLHDPKGYLDGLKGLLGERYTIVEKILAWEEDLPGWPVFGTTGYDFLNRVNGLFCRKDNAYRFDRIYRDFTGINEPYDEMVYDKKKRMMEIYMCGEMDNLTRLLKCAAEKDRSGHDFTFFGLRRALAEFMASLSVYRTYRANGELSRADSAAVESALAGAIGRQPEVSREIGFLGKVITGSSKMQSACESNSESMGWGAKECGERPDFVARLQQFTGPFMAKGFEDTVLYCYNRLISLNEVGGSPDRFGTTAEEFHRYNDARFKKWPHSLNATATHDTKRGEDARMRISVLSEIPDEWQGSLIRWSKLNEPKRRRLNGRLVPDRNEEYLIYQALIGAFPFISGDSSEDLSAFRDRAKEYLIKALREAKTHSDWMDADPKYEEAVLSFLEDITDPSSAFFEDFLSFQKKVAFLGIHNSLSQALLKIASPGVPDFFQGTELWDFSFVDPDNRRPVDFEKRRLYLEEIKNKDENGLGGFIGELMKSSEDGRIKLFLIQRLLKARRENADLFQKGIYMSMQADSMVQADGIHEHNDGFVAFARIHEGKWALALASRFPASCEAGDDEAFIQLTDGSPQKWRNVITGTEMAGRKIYLKEAFANLPAALLIGTVGR